MKLKILTLVLLLAFGTFAHANPILKYTGKFAVDGNNIHKDGVRGMCQYYF